MRVLEENSVSVEEMEAIRLRDIDHLEQVECAARMNVSRPTFQRILASARSKIADALLNGKAITIEGGNFEMTARRFRCGHGHEWNAGADLKKTDLPEACPRCSSTEITPVTGRMRMGRHGKRD
jgi:predicted DNA-binding protein (UPF0251 family)